MNDRTLSKYHGKIFTVSNKSIGKGAYGNVVTGNDEYNQKIAIKCCPIKEDGIPNIFEASVMQSIIHPNINSSIEILSTVDFLYIIQPLAVTDLYNYTNKLKYILSIEELKNIFYSLIQAVYLLHGENIIHCDIKASNVLLYNDGSVKLTDFTLSIKKLKENMYAHTVCTSTHRDLSIHLKHPWDERIDLWSLGCTFYEITYNEWLFKQQNITLGEDKGNLKFKYINSIIDWATLTNQPCDTPLYNTDYNTIVLSDNYFNNQYTDINKIINQLLIINPENRVKLEELLKDDLFKDKKPINPKFIVVKDKKLNHDEEARVVRYIQQLTIIKDVEELALSIYKKINLSYGEYHKAAGCTFIALKILIGNHHHLFSVLPKELLLNIERDICHDLHFRLHL